MKKEKLALVLFAMALVVIAILSLLPFSQQKSGGYGISRGTCKNTPYPGVNLAGCPKYGMEQELVTQDPKELKSVPNCLEPHLETIPSPMPQKNPRSVTPVPNLDIPAWWKPQLNIKQQAQYEDIIRDRRFYAALDILAYKNQLWIAHGGGLVRFDVNHKVIKTYQIPIDASSTSYYSFADLYLRNGEIWAVLTSSKSVLAKYHLAKDTFIIVHDKDGLLNYGHAPTVINVPSLIGELPGGKLVFVLGWEIFSYDPANQQAKKLLGLESGYRVNTIAASTNNTVWFTTVNDDVIRSLDTVTSKVEEYGEPPSLVRDEGNQTGLADYSSKAITVDSQGRVWVGYFDRLEPDKNGNYTWHELKRPTIFVDDTHIYDTYDRAVYVYKWTPVFSVAQFSDENMWFVTGVGVVRYDVAGDDWCWSATQSFWGDAFSPIAEDENGNIWMVDYVMHQVYKLEQ
jgi:hypothetical protein